jgi:hypothetical protein
MYQGAAYCKNCFVKLFKRRGRYSVFTQEKDEVVEVEVEGDDPRAGLPPVSEEEKLLAKKEEPASPKTPAEPVSPKTPVEPITPKTPKAVEPASPTAVTTESKAWKPAQTPTSSTGSSAATPKFLGPRCKKCEKSAYPEESIKYDGILYHNACFKCKECKFSLTVKNVAQFQGEVYCKNCFVRMFKTKGTYTVFKEGSTPMEPTSPTSAS